MENHFAILNVHRGSDLEEMRLAYIKLAKLLHPDKGGTSNEFTKLNDAYGTLTTAPKLAKYLKELDRECSPCKRCTGAGYLNKQLSFTDSKKTICTACGGAGVKF